MNQKPFQEQVLLMPGPTPIQPQAAAALAWPMRGHMDTDVFAINEEIQKDLQTMYGTAGFTCLLAGTGSLGMEAGFANLLEAGDSVLICSNGSFGERMVEMTKRLGADVTVVAAPIGHAVRAEAVEVALSKKKFKLVAVVHGETSTGVLNPAKEIAALARKHGALVTVDAVTTAGMMPFYMDAWGIDYAYTGSQKCLSAPPGVAPVAFSRQAEEAVGKRKSAVPMWYADLHGLQDYWNKRQYHHTVAVQLHYALHQALKAALNEGLSERQARVKHVGAATLSTLESIGFSAFVKEAANRLPTVLAVTLPDGLDDAAVRQALRERNVIVTGGLGETAGKIWRLGLMGESARPELYTKFFTNLEIVLGQRGLAEHFLKNMGDAKFVNG